MADESDGKDIRPDAPEKRTPEELLGLFKGTPQQSTENDKVDGFLSILVRHARLVLLDNRFAIFEKLAAKSVDGSIQHLKWLFGVAEIEDLSDTPGGGESSPKSYLTSKLFHEIINFWSESGSDGRDLKPAKPPLGQSPVPLGEDKATDQFPE